jgi:hypothetical protein
VERLGVGLDIDASIDRLLGELLVPLILGAAVVFVYFAALARTYHRSRMRLALLEECRRRRFDQEALLERLGAAPRLAHYRRLEAALTRAPLR